MTRPPFPSHVKVGWKRYRVAVWQPEVAAAEHKYGECDHVNNEIKVDVTKGHRQAAETLWHECLHAAFDIGALHALPGAADDQYPEEFMVSFFASWTITLLGDNPALLAFLSWAASQEE